MQATDTAPRLPDDASPVSIFARSDKPTPRPRKKAATPTATSTATPNDDASNDARDVTGKNSNARGRSRARRDSEPVAPVDDAHTNVEPPKTHSADDSTRSSERDALRAAGMKRCPSHVRLLDQLEDEAAKRPYGDYPVEVRQLSDFAKSTSSCRACDSIIQRAWRQAHKTAGAERVARTRLPRVFKIGLMQDEVDTLTAAYPDLNLTQAVYAVFARGYEGVALQLAEAREHDGEDLDCDGLSGDPAFDGANN